MADEVLFNNEQLTQKVNEAKDALKTKLESERQLAELQRRKDADTIDELRAMVRSTVPTGRVILSGPGAISAKDYIKYRALANNGNAEARRYLYGE